VIPISAEPERYCAQVLVTRSAHQAEGFCALLDQEGFEAIPFPTLCIQGLSQTTLEEQLEPLASAEIVLFTSANAVHYANRDGQLSHRISGKACVLAVGPATTAALAACTIPAQHPKHDHSSAGLLTMEALQQVARKQVVLVRGAGGLNTLPAALLSANAHLSIAEVYHRQIPDTILSLKAQFHTRLPRIISTTSNESLSNLVTLCTREERDCLSRTPLIVNSKRGEALAKTLGFSNDILLASPVGDHGQVCTLKAWITERLTQR